MDGTAREADDALRAARARETALREILDVLSRSRDDEAPVFEAIVENVCRLLGLPHAGLYLVNPAGDAIDLVTSRGARPNRLTPRYGARPRGPAIDRERAVYRITR